jgi:hypothetical protein
MFRGELGVVWERRLVERHHWPRPLATQLAAFLVGTGPMPDWPSFATDMGALFDTPGKLTRGRIVEP